jgi:hypothetical protein
MTNKWDDSMTAREREIICGLSHWLDALMAEHPEVCRVKIRCMRDDESLLFDLLFSRKTARGGETAKDGQSVEAA